VSDVGRKGSPEDERTKHIHTHTGRERDRERRAHNMPDAPRKHDRKSAHEKKKGHTPEKDEEHNM